MPPIKMNDLKRFVGIPVEIAIQDQEAEEQAPAVMKTIRKVQECPDNTHVRFYFDDFYFLAVPLTSQVNETVDHWSAMDGETNLIYTIKKVF